MGVWYACVCVHVCGINSIMSMLEDFGALIDCSSARCNFGVRTIEDMKEDKAVYRAVRAAIMAAHQEDGVTVADIVGETEEQKQAGRIKYLVVAEERGICIQ